MRFANPLVESEFRRALDVLPMSHDEQKKSVSLHFAGKGKRKVQIGYVIEAPIWNEAVIRVKDTGAGIAPSMLPEVFELFKPIDHPCTIHAVGWVLGWPL